MAANDGTGGGAIAAFKAAGVNPVPPVTGNDATLAGLQLIIAGDQYNTILKPSEIVAAAAAKVAVDFLSGQSPKAETTIFNTPSQLFKPAVVTPKNLKAEIVDKGFESAENLCTGRYAEGCKQLGITKRSGANDTPRRIRSHVDRAEPVRPPCSGGRTFLIMRTVP